MADVGQDIERAANILRSGGVVAIPTETVYGLAANGLDEKAVAKIYHIKQRPSFNPLILHIPNIEHLAKYAEKVDEDALKLAMRFWPGPLTLVLPKKSIVPDLTTAGNDSVALRCPNHPLTLDLLRVLDFPLAAPSANPSGYISPTTAEHVQSNLGDLVDYILDGGPCKVGVESSIVSFLSHPPQILRLGSISKEDMSESIVDIKSDIIASNGKLIAPGMMSSHYAPRKPLIFGEIKSISSVSYTKKTVLLNFHKTKKFAPEATQYILSESGDLDEAARNLFAMLRKIDDMDVDKIFAEPVPSSGIGLAINDRLQRASIPVDKENNFGT